MLAFVSSFDAVTPGRLRRIARLCGGLRAVQAEEILFDEPLLAGAESRPKLQPRCDAAGHAHLPDGPDLSPCVTRQSVPLQQNVPSFAFLEDAEPLEFVEVDRSARRDEFRADRTLHAHLLNERGRLVCREAA